MPNSVDSSPFGDSHEPRLLRWEADHWRLRAKKMSEMLVRASAHAVSVGDDTLVELLNVPESDASQINRHLALRPKAGPQ